MFTRSALEHCGCDNDGHPPNYRHAFAGNGYNPRGFLRGNP